MDSAPKMTRAMPIMGRLVSAVRPCVNSVVTLWLAVALNSLRAASARGKSLPSTTDKSIRKGDEAQREQGSELKRAVYESKSPSCVQIRRGRVCSSGSGRSGKPRWPTARRLPGPLTRTVPGHDGARWGAPLSCGRRPFIGSVMADFLLVGHLDRRIEMRTGVRIGVSGVTGWPVERRITCLVPAVTACRAGPLGRYRGPPRRGCRQVLSRQAQATREACGSARS